MNAYRSILETILFEFDWGQNEPENDVPDPTNFALTTEDLQNQPTYENLIARYLNWYAKCQTILTNSGTDLINSSEGIDFRGRTLAAIQARLVKSDPDHPALVVLSRDCQNYKKQLQDSICTSPKSFGHPEKLNSLFIRVK